MVRSSYFVLVVALAIVACGRRPAPTVTPAAPIAPAQRLVPMPVDMALRDGLFTFTPNTLVAATSPDFAFSARFLADHIGQAVGPDPLKVEVTATPPGGAITIRQTADDAALGEEGYVLEVRPEGITILAARPAGAFYGVQTLRQLLPPAWEYEALRPPRKSAPPVTLPAMEITDRPRFEWRGAMLDVSRHFLSVDEVKRYVDLMALHKLNRLHLHLADDQGWRIEITSWPNLTTHGGSTEVGGGPGGFYTQAEYSDIVRYAADRFITIVPEIDMPGHTNAALSSYPELNCDGVAPPLYTGTEVGFSTLCVDKEITYKFIEDIVREISKVTPGPYFHVGGDEVEKLTDEQYRRFIERVQGIVQLQGKRMIGWDEIAPANLQPGAIVQHWRPKTTPAEAVGKGAKVIMSVANRAYIDMKYDANTPIGLTWAGIVDVKTSYDWNPADEAPGVPEAALLGVEAPLWAETIANIRDVEFLAFPRLAAIAEIGWSRQRDRDWDDFRVRLGSQGSRWVALGVNFYRAPEIPWR